MHVHSVLTVVALFFVGLVSPGPNFFVVVQASLTSGRVAGLITGLGAATGDAVYATIGLFGVTRLVAVGGHAMMVIELLGGIYLSLLGIRMLIRHRDALPVQASPSAGAPARSHFWRGLATDLANPKTVVFFASIFAVTVTPESPRTVRAAMLLGIVVISVLWRLLLSVVFSATFIRSVYVRAHVVFERVFGAALCMFGLLLVRRAGS